MSAAPAAPTYDFLELFGCDPSLIYGTPSVTKKGGTAIWLKYDTGGRKDASKEDHSPPVKFGGGGTTHTGAMNNPDNPTARKTMRVFFEDGDPSTAAKIAFIEAVDNRCIQIIIENKNTIWPRGKVPSDEQIATDFTRSVYVPEGRSPQIKFKIKHAESSMSQNTRIYVTTRKRDAQGLPKVRVGDSTDITPFSTIEALEFEGGGIWFMGKKKDEIGVTFAVKTLVVTQGESKTYIPGGFEIDDVPAAAEEADAHPADLDTFTGFDPPQ